MLRRTGRAPPLAHTLPSGRIRHTQDPPFVRAMAARAVPPPQPLLWLIPMLLLLLLLLLLPLLPLAVLPLSPRLQTLRPLLLLLLLLLLLPLLPSASFGCAARPECVARPATASIPSPPLAALLSGRLARGPGHGGCRQDGQRAPRKGPLGPLAVHAGGRMRRECSSCDAAACARPARLRRGCWHW